MDKKGVLPVVAATIILTIIVGLATFYILMWSVLKHQRIESLTRNDGRVLVQFVDQLQAAGKTIIGPCITQEDLSSIGDKVREQRMEVLNQLLTLSEARSGRPARGIGDLNNLARLSYPRSSYVDQIAKNCSVFAIDDATLLNCDGLELTPTVAKAVSTFSPNQRRFYIINGHEVLFRPPVKCN